MEYEIAAVGQKHFVLGFKAAGVRYCMEAADSKEAKAALDKLLEKEEIGLIVIGESVAKEMLQYIEEISQARVLPAITVLQDGVKSEHLSSRSINNYVEKATGILFLEK